MLKQDMHVYRMVALWLFIKDPSLNAGHGIDDDIPGFPVPRAEPSAVPVPDAAAWSYQLSIVEMRYSIRNPQ